MSGPPLPPLKKGSAKLAVLGASKEESGPAPNNVLPPLPCGFSPVNCFGLRKANVVIGGVLESEHAAGQRGPR